MVDSIGREGKKEIIDSVNRGVCAGGRRTRAIGLIAFSDSRRRLWRHPGRRRSPSLPLHSNRTSTSTSASGHSSITTASRRTGTRTRRIPRSRSSRETRIGPWTTGGSRDLRHPACSSFPRTSSGNTRCAIPVDQHKEILCVISEQGTPIKGTTARNRVSSPLLDNVGLER